jgi:predicted outer membrane repeat protein
MKQSPCGEGKGVGKDNHASSPRLDNVIFSGNDAGTSGGGIYNNASSPTIRNSILWENQDKGGAEASAQI